MPWLDPARPSVRAYSEFRRLFGSDEVYVVQLSGDNAPMFRKTEYSLLGEKCPECGANL